MEKPIGEQTIAIPLQITVNANLTFFGKVGLAIMKFGAFIMGISTIKIKEIEKEEQKEKIEVKEKKNQPKEHEEKEEK